LRRLKFVAARSNAACKAEDAVRDAGHARETCDRGNENFFRRPTRMSGASRRTRPSKSLIPAVSGGIVTSLPIFEYRPVQMDDLDPHRTETQKEWKDWPTTATARCTSLARCCGSAAPFHASRGRPCCDREACVDRALALTPPVSHGRVPARASRRGRRGVGERPLPRSGKAGALPPLDDHACVQKRDHQRLENAGSSFSSARRSSSPTAWLKALSNVGGRGRCLPALSSVLG
jgi:hypothetical protein